MPKITVEVPISAQCLCDILSAAFEGGINYWLSTYETSHPSTLTTLPKGERLECQYMAPAYGGTVRLYSTDLDETEGPYLLNQGNLLTAISRAAKEGRFQIEVYEGDLDASDIDAEVADVIVQYAVLGEIVFG